MPIRHCRHLLCGLGGRGAHVGRRYHRGVGVVPMFFGAVSECRSHRLRVTGMEGRPWHLPLWASWSHAGVWVSMISLDGTMSHPTVTKQEQGHRGAYKLS